MRKLLFLLPLWGCSLVNSTSDLRDSVADGGLDGTVDGPIDVPDDVPSEDGTTEIGPDEGDAPVGECPGDFLVTAIDFLPEPTFLLELPDGHTCSGQTTVSIEGEDYELNADVQPETLEYAFVYTGLRVPLFDGRERRRTVTFAGESIDITMPVEQLQVYESAAEDSALTRAVRFGAAPQVDIDDVGNVVFQSTDLLALGARTGLEDDADATEGGNVFLWRMLGPDDDFGRPRIDQPGIGVAPDFENGSDVRWQPRINDDGSVIAFITLSRVEGPRVEYVRLEEESRLLAGPLVDGDDLTLDLRTDGDNRSFVLVHDGNENSVFRLLQDPGFTPVDVSSRASTPGLLSFPEGDVAYGAVAIPEGQAMRVLSEGAVPEVLQSNCGVERETAAPGTRARVNLEADPGVVHTVQCARSTVRQIAVGEGLEFPIEPDGNVGDNSLFLNMEDSGDDSLLLGDPDTAVPGLEYALRGPAMSPVTVPLLLQGDGTPAEPFEGVGMDGASISPNGEWAVWAVRSFDEDADTLVMEVFRAPLRDL
ncbi:MAG: hypothetical protein AAF411_22260 [Myxococcota bacterium]